MRLQSLLYVTVASTLVVMPQTLLAAQVTVQVKSFIRLVDLMDPKQFDPDAKTCQAAMAAIVTCGTVGGEDPSAGGKADGGYRLWSEVKADVECSANKVARWNLLPVVHDAGKEFGFLPTSGEISPALSAVPSLKGATSVDRVTFKYRMRGQPNAAGNKVMNEVKPRSCTYIWHDVDGAISCKDGKPEMTVSMRASGFPSHRLWINGKRAQDIAQGPFKSLWACDPFEPSLVK
jgi:hypothetical protein